ncbi:MAG: D-sedoheptulose-7-phosphate isomerase [Thermoplasmata archaeon]
MNDLELINEYIKEGIKAREAIDKEQVLRAANLIVKTFKNRRKLIFMGNGGSAADAQHIAAEFVGKFEINREPLPALALHCNTSSITAIGNDFGFETIFERQIEAFAQEGDTIFALSTSGNSQNVINGIKKAEEMKCNVLGITGSDGGVMKELIDGSLLFRVGSNTTSIIQETTITIGHILTKLVERELYQR